MYCVDAADLYLSLPQLRRAVGVMHVQFRAVFEGFAVDLRDVEGRAPRGLPSSGLSSSCLHSTFRESQAHDARTNYVASPHSGSGLVGWSLMAFGGFELSGSPKCGSVGGAAR
ncbi:hypothetical protein SLUN_37710 [Streptomyces lunaelactis]|uniref:Uncharacterized protein n=1 Tax=Streptomyces lunaelactis TaxID=1535768 RepID=A0A2R4TD68_9ACTN|nr:hypothetical protein SLUN_37710 [Streptomyces lunaelactis]